MLQQNLLKLFLCGIFGEADVHKELLVIRWSRQVTWL